MQSFRESACVDALVRRPLALAVCVATVIASSSGARAGEPVERFGFDARLRPPEVVLAARRPVKRPSAPAPLPAPAPAPAVENSSTPSLDFDLLGPGEGAAQAPVATAEARPSTLRRTMLTYHQLLGIGLLLCETATVVVGQLNYQDRFGGGPSSARYQQTHKLLAYGTAGLFAGTGLLALLAPSPKAKQHQGFDRVLLHKLGMFTAAAGMATEVGLGIYTASREGYLDQASLARTHLVVGYITLAATYLGVGSIVF
jgi:hypothetical protein